MLGTGLYVVWRDFGVGNNLWSMVVFLCWREPSRPREDEAKTSRELMFIADNEFSKKWDLDADRDIEDWDDLQSKSIKFLAQGLVS